MPQKIPGSGAEPRIRRGTIPKPTTRVEPKHGVSPAIPLKSPDHSLVITNGINLGFNSQAAVGVGGGVDGGVDGGERVDVDVGGRGWTWVEEGGKWRNETWSCLRGSALKTR